MVRRRKLGAEEVADFGMVAPPAARSGAVGCRWVTRPRMGRRGGRSNVGDQYGEPGDNISSGSTRWRLYARFVKVLGSSEVTGGARGRNIFAGFFNHVVPIIGARFNGWTGFLSPVNGTSQPLCSPHSLTGTLTGAARQALALESSLFFCHILIGASIC